VAQRTFQQEKLGLQKRRVELWAFIAVPTGTTPVLQKYNYPQLGVGGRTLSAAPTAAAPLGFPQSYAAGSEGIFSVARTATGLWTLTLQDNYQRLLTVSGAHSIAGGTTNIVMVTENPTITSMSTANGSVIGIALLSATATLADPTAGATSLVRIKLELQDATEP
jgi:hypothetical protein